MLRPSLLTAFVALAGPAAAQSPERAHIDEAVSRISQAHGVPETLVHRVIQRESRYAPRTVARGHYGLMQISYATARSMGYSGKPAGLLDVETNLNYAVPYLANAWKLSGGSQDRAVRLYSGGYYYVAKRKGEVASLRNASSPTLAPPPAEATAYAPAQEEDGVAGFFRNLMNPQPQTRAE